VSAIYQHPLALVTLSVREARILQGADEALARGYPIPDYHAPIVAAIRHHIDRVAAWKFSREKMK